MKQSNVSQTALKVASMMLSLGADDRWRERLPPGLIELTRTLLLAAKAPPYTPTVIALNERRITYLASKAYERLIPGVFTGIGERKIFIDRQAREALAAGVEQVAVIGAGFDTLCLRLAPAFPAVSFFEIDQSATTEAKARGVDHAGRPANFHQVIADLSRQPLADVLANAEGWNRQASSLVVAEGLLMYLEEDDVRSLFDSAASAVAPSSRFVFSYPLGVQRYALSNALLSMIGEPWLSHTDRESLPDYIGDAWSVSEAVQPMGGRAIEGFAVAIAE